MFKNPFKFGLLLITAICVSQFSSAQSFTEGTDMANSGSGIAYTVAGPSITIAGQLNTPGDGQDHFQVIVPAGCSITGVTYSITDPNPVGISGFFHFGNNNDQSFTGPTSSSFALAGQFPSVSFPAGPGTYDCFVSANIAYLSNWTMTFATTCVACTDPTVPTITASPSTICPGSSTTLNISGTLNDATQWAVYTGSCGGTLLGTTVTSTFAVTPGSTTTYYIRGEGGCVTPGICGTATVTVGDVTPPTAVCQNINAYIDGAGNVSITAADIDGGSTDNCGAVALSASQTVFNCADIGPNNVTLTVTDGSMNTSNCVSTVTVMDTVSPTVSCNSGIQNISDDGTGDCTFTPFAVGQAGSYNIADNCSGPLTVVEVFTGALSTTSTFSLTAGTGYTPVQAFPVGVTNVAVTVTDASGNSSSCSYTTTILDDEAPNAVCQNITVYLDGSGNVSITAADIDGGSTDNCGGVLLSASQTSFTCANLGANNVTLTVTDGNSNTANCAAVVTVSDTTSPVITCPGNQVEVASASCDFVLPDYTGLGTAVDNCGATTITQSPAAGTTISSNTTITFTATDASGNTSICTFDVTLDISGCQGVECSNAIALAAMSPCGDIQTVSGSTFGGTPSTEAFCGTSLGSGGANWYTFTGDGTNWTVSTVNGGTNYDSKLWIYEGTCGALNCITGNDDFTGVQSQVSFATTLGSTYYIVVGGFSSSEGSYVMTMTNVETEAPVADLAALADINDVCEVTSLTAPTATDNCSAVTVTNDATLPITASSTITWTYTDANGNSSTQTQNVILVDPTPPTASNPAPMTAECLADIPAPDPTVVTDAADNCAAPTVTWSSDVSDGGSCPETITRTYTVTDGSGNAIDVMQTITVLDVTNPTASNPSTLNVQCTAEIPAPSTGWVTDEADNCTANPVVTWVSDVSDGASCPETITRTFNVADDCGNSINVVQLIIVNDVQAPTADVINLPTETAFCNVTLTAPTATDNCSGSITGTTSTVFPINTSGTTTVTWTYTDNCGNVSTQTQDVVINNINVSTSMANDGITFLANNLTAGVSYQWIDCLNNNQPIAGATNHNYTPTYGSDFAVIVTQDGCSDTSACLNSVVGIDELGSADLIVYPNPTNGVFTVSFNGEIASIQVFDMLGRIIDLPIVNATVDASTLVSGKYFVRVTTVNEQTFTKEFVVQK